MVSRVVTVVLAVGLFFSLLILAVGLADLRIPDDQQGYEPAQPIAFSHRLHAGELDIGCLFCHAGDEKSRYAGFPAASTCMYCHFEVSATFGAVRAEAEAAEAEGRAVRRIVSTELETLYEALALDENMERDPAKTLTPIAWVKVHDLPDYTYFDHRAHASAGVTCAACHGPIETMERVRQEESLSMGWCVNCHRDGYQAEENGKSAYASVDCATCHF